MIFNLITQQSDIDKIYLYATDPYESKYKLLNNKWESTSLMHVNDSKAFIDYANDIDNNYNTIQIKNVKY